MSSYHSFSMNQRLLTVKSQQSQGSKCWGQFLSVSSIHQWCIFAGETTKMHLNFSISSFYLLQRIRVVLKYSSLTRAGLLDPGSSVTNWSSAAKSVSLDWRFRNSQLIPPAIWPRSLRKKRFSFKGSCDPFGFHLNFYVENNNPVFWFKSTNLTVLLVIFSNLWIILNKSWACSKKQTTKQTAIIFLYCLQFISTHRCYQNLIICFRKTHFQWLMTSFTHVWHHTYTRTDNHRYVQKQLQHPFCSNVSFSLKTEIRCGSFITYDLSSPIPYTTDF